ncbi:PEP-CTERM sorting domain-containing protein [Roseomonas alkaliterrae]|uniref:PEP-CTERM protein-sorting domain-containing protein n=1 Tax=Neoroseomonas alkaliterrae TaxID=1452450 RepID=A0A840Y3X0_9PROT|nr:PEP-CTERM sorting domain-containing protein [Neoroseomonas alkaliterrae]MBB5691067.1 hypothetical protein [Neoroseomonas alkaliterrae]MBR0674742.1 PEP-CTERM sorting domain-containing protein [Neoroseomonas alkaliterrae]
MSLRKALFAASALLGLAFAAPATQASTVGTIPGGATANNQVIAPLPKIEGWYGANLYLIGGPSQITATLIGYEAGWTNSFVWNGTPILTGGGGTSGTLGSPIGTSVTINNVLSGLLPFMFDTNGGGNPTFAANGDVVNGANVLPNNNLGNFFVTLGNCTALSCIDTTINGITASSGTVAWLFFDDLGAGPDDNHDDLVIRLEITGGSVRVPAPASIALLGMGLLGLGAVVRRRRAAA